MAPSKPVGSSGTKSSHHNSTKSSTTAQRTTISENMDSSRPVHGTDNMSPAPEPATAAMIDVSSWAQRGLVLENKDLRRTLEMTKSAHTAQLAQIAKRHKTEKEELEVKLEAETYRLAAQQRTLDELTTRLEGVEEDNGKLTGSVEAMDKHLIAKTEENSRLQREIKDSKSKLKSADEELDNIKAKQEELLARESRVAAVLNDQHHKIMNLSQAYHEQESGKLQLQAMLETAEKEVTRLRSRLSGILNTLVKVVHDNGDDLESDAELTGGDSVGMKEVMSGAEISKKPEGRKRTRASDQHASDVPPFLPPRPLVNPPSDLSVSVAQVDQGSPIPMTPKHALTLTTTPTANSSSAGTSPCLDASVDNRRSGVRAKRRRIVSDPEFGESKRQSQQIQVKQEPLQSDVTMADMTTSNAVRGEDGTLDIEESVTVTEVEVSIPATMHPGMDTLREDGEDSPERAAVESAIGVQDEESTSQLMGEETESGTIKKIRTYGKKRKAKEAIETLHVDPEVPASEAQGKNSVAERTTASTAATPPADLSRTTPQTSTYATRAKLAKSLKTVAGNEHPSVNSGSPFLKKRQHDKHSHAQSDDRMSPRAIKVKEEVLDSTYDGRPRITGRDDEEDPLCI
ncbi:hypothetical protein QFC20_006635 [Naganishia adeliensis]|uniref:Uncharacterized protein n=1 Tax=Naganishia adeliensis TaxID=92952 RepID=A0ACC2VA95_9TREE|nr:hypothetical protein QFC20_006635 [Naganishia adeliensis]